MLVRLKQIRKEVEVLWHKTKSDQAYSNARSIATELIIIAPDEECKKNFDKDRRILNKYTYKGSDSFKADVIAEFRAEIIYDLDALIGKIERGPNPPIQ